MSWRQLTVLDRSTHFFPDNEDTLQQVACGVYYNVRFTREPSKKPVCEQCQEVVDGRRESQGR